MNIVTLVELYLLIGVTVASLLHRLLEWNGEEVKPTEAISMICAWPVMSIVFLWYFFKEIIS